MATGILRIQAFAARQSSPIEGVTVNVSGDGFTATRLTDAEGNAADVTLTTPACALSLDENNTTQAPYAVCSLVASKPGYRTDVYKRQVQRCALHRAARRSRCLYRERHG